MKNDISDEDDDPRPDKTAGMVVWTRRLAFYLAFAAFAVMFLASMGSDFGRYMDVSAVIISTVKGLGAGLLLWIAGLIIGNILLKGLITDVPVDQDHLLDGGLLQRIYLYQQQLNYDTDGNVIHIDPKTNMAVKKNARSKKKT